MGVDLSLNRTAEWPAVAAVGSPLRAAARAALATRQPSPEGSVSVTFVSEPEIRSLNGRWLGRDAPTDVIAFDLGGDGPLLGDIYICPPVAARGAREARVPVEEELARLVVHGILHLLGHEHPEGEDREASAMFRLQEEVLRRAGVLGRPATSREAP